MTRTRVVIVAALAVCFAVVGAIALSAGSHDGPDGAVVTWRPKPDPDSVADDSRRTMFIEQGGRWLVYRCCP